MLALALALAAPDQAAAAPPRGAADIVAAAPASEWVAIAPDDLLVLELAPDAQGGTRRVLVQLMPKPFGQGWVDNIRTLARTRWWDGASVYRVQDNYVAQWGDATEKKPLPPGLKTVPESDYVVRTRNAMFVEDDASGWLQLPELAATTAADPYAERSGFFEGFPIAGTRPQQGLLWPVHCYGTVGVGRDLSPNTGSGAELYAVIGHGPRHLDRNIAVVGRVVEGIAHLSSLPRGTKSLGFYETEAERTPIRSVRLASELPEAERPRMQYLSTEGQSFAAYADARANRREPFFIRPAGGADVCNIPVPIRRAPQIEP
jgi:cyclophilin family peptidyl-prolyl cis-trans isomerase